LRKMYWLLLFIPIALALKWFEVNPVVIFVCSAMSLIPLAGLMGDATEALSSYMGTTYGGLLNASLGNAPEIIISFFALKQGLVEIVKASITGSIIGNLLLGLGLSMFLGGLKNGTQVFNVAIAKMNSGLLTLAAIGLIIPAVFKGSTSSVARAISPQIAGILFLLYVASLVYTVIANRPVMGLEAVEAETGTMPEPDGGGEEHWSKQKAIGILAAVAVALAFMSEVLTDAIEPAAEMIGLTPIFAGVFLLAAVGNAAEIINAVRFARKGHMDLAIGVTVGASIQVALVVAPVLVFFGFVLHKLGYIPDKSMDLLFSTFEVVSISLAVFVSRNVTIDGESNWLEGLMLLSLYFMLGFGFYYLPRIAVP
jgi:Ca2+:H+ antiporter